MLTNPNRFRFPPRLLLTVATSLFFVLAAAVASAQLGLNLPGKLGDIIDGKESGTAAGGGGFASAATFRNNDRQFEYTIPAGWRQESGDPQSEKGALYMKPGTSWSFQFHMTQMTPSFPAESSVQASIQQAKEMQQINKILEVKRRDDSDKKGNRTLSVIGWEIVQSPKGADGGYQRIIWQCYDQDNYYFNFMASAKMEDFEAARSTLRTIVDSVDFKLE
ncbi:MAG: hypothetical protein ACOCWR_11340 [Oceanidesulfovibrio sp.]